MSMLHTAAAGVDIRYKDKRTLPLLEKIASQWWRRPSTRYAAIAAIKEVETLRERLSQATIEVSEWRYKVGGAAYKEYGAKFAGMVEQGMRDRIGTWLTITDEDLRS